MESVADLARAMTQRTIHTLEGFGPAVVDRIGRGLEARARMEGRALLSEADRTRDQLGSVLDSAGLTWQPAGDVARRQESVATIELVTVSDPERLHDTLAGQWPVTSPRGANPIELGSAPPARVVATDATHLGAVVHHLTGPPAYLAALGGPGSGRRPHLDAPGSRSRRRPPHRR